MKTGIEHKIPLRKQMLSILNDSKLIATFSPYIFPVDRDPKSHVNKASANMALKRMGYQGKQTAHGLRGLARTALSDQGFAYEPCLSPKVGNSVSQSYNHSTYLNQRVEIMMWWIDHLVQNSIGDGLGRFNSESQWA